MTAHRFRIVARAREHLVRARHALRVRFVALVSLLLIRPLLPVTGWLRRSPTMPSPEGVSPALPAAEPAVSPVAEPESLPAQLARVGAPEFVGHSFVRVVAEPEFGESQYADKFAELQREPGAKLLDLRGVRTVQLALFKHLAQSWCVGRSVVTHLGILLDYERWVRFHAVGGSRLRALGRRGVEVEIFYEQQFPQAVSAWFAGRGVEHPLLTVLVWLRTEWRPGVDWTSVLDMTAMLIEAFGHRSMVPGQLLQLAAVALSKRAVDGAGPAITHIRAALSSLGDAPSRMQCRALRLLGCALQRHGDMEAALAQLEAAIGIAARIGDRIEAATAQADVVAYALRHGDAARAEARCRVALALLTADDDVPHLHASLRHKLALALHEQRKNLDEAEQQAAHALALRGDSQSRLAIADRELLARIRATRSSPSSETMGVPA